MAKGKTTAAAAAASSGKSSPGKTSGKSASGKNGPAKNVSGKNVSGKNASGKSASAAKKSQNAAKAEEKRRRRALKKEEKKRYREQQAQRQQRRRQMEEQLAQEDSEAYENLMRRRRQWKKSRRRHSYILMLVILAVVGLVMCFRMFITITEIRVVGESRYSDADLILSSGLEIGEHLYDFEPDLVARDILEGHIYLESVQVRRVLPTTVEIQVSPVMETGVVQGETGFSIISSGGKVLETGILYPPSELPLITGLPLSVDRSDAEKVNQLNKRLEALSALNAAMTFAKFTGVTSIDLTDMLSIVIVYQDRVKILLGDSEDLEQKISFASRALETIDAASQGIIDVSMVKKAFFREESIHPDYTPEFIPESAPESGSPQEPETGEGSPDESGSASASESAASPQIPQIPPSANIP